MFTTLGLVLLFGETLLIELSVDGGRPLLGGLSGVCREALALTMVDTAGTNVVSS